MTLKAKQKLLTIDTRLKLLYNSVLHSLVPPAYSSRQVKTQDSRQVKTPDFKVHGIAPWSLSPCSFQKQVFPKTHGLYTCTQVYHGQLGDSKCLLHPFWEV